jgi:ABC-type multidrug transport system permease subunit
MFLVLSTLDVIIVKTKRNYLNTQLCVFSPTIQVGPMFISHFILEFYPKFSYCLAIWILKMKHNAVTLYISSIWIVPVKITFFIIIVLVLFYLLVVGRESGAFHMLSMCFTTERQP